MIDFLNRRLLLIAVTLSSFGFGLAYSQSWNLELAVLVTTVLTLAAAITLERLRPFRDDWRTNRDNLRTDLTSAVVLVALADPLLKFLGPFLVVVVYDRMNLASSNLSELPLLLQILLATLLIEFGRYWSHRLHHRMPSLWRLHAMHHSSESLYAINTLRFNPLNYLLNFVIGAMPAMLLGFSAEALLAYLAITQPVLMLQHANLNLKNGWLNYLFSTNELHRWHHSTESAEANSNYGNAIILWDQLFGTFRYEPESNNTPAHVGLFASSRGYPSQAGYFRQLCASVWPRCCAAG